MELPINQIICGDCLEVMKDWPDTSINCCISSPPYWALRDYGVDGQLGLEPTFEEYIDKLCTIYDEVKRVLRPDGTCWVNMGDTYGTHAGTKNSKYAHNFKTADVAISEGIYQPRKPQSVPEKCLCLIPQRFAIEMVNRGWILRNVIIWHKPNPMPSSAKDRFTVDFEYVYFFIKSKRYWFETQYEASLPHKGEVLVNRESGTGIARGIDGQADRQGNFKANPLGRNKRTVWTIPTQPFPEAHFATYPEKLVEPMIKAGCPEFICTKCGKAREKIYTETSGGAIGKAWLDHSKDSEQGNMKTTSSKGYEKGGFKGYTDCECNAAWRSGIVLDPFCGAATTLYVAAKLRRDYVGIELSQEYIDKIAKPRLAAVEIGVPVKEQRAGQMGLFTEEKE